MISIGEIVIAPDGRIWVLDEIDNTRENNAKLKNGCAYTSWPIRL